MEDFSHIRAIERPKDARDVLLGSVQAPISIPSSYIPDMSWFVRNYQGQTPTCGAHAASHLKQILDHFQNPSVAPHYSPRFSWIRIKAIDGFPLEDGTDMRSIFKSLQSDGADNFEPLENDVLLPLAEYSELSAITPAMTANAAPKKILSYAFGNTDFESLCQYVYQNKAALILLHCDNGFWGTSIPKFTTTPYTHYIVAYGYDEANLYIVDSADPDAGFAFKIVNKEFIVPKFILESGTALDIPPPAVVAPIVQEAAQIVQEVTTSPAPVPEKETLLDEVVKVVQEIETII